MALLVSALFMFISMVISIFNDMDSAMGPLAISGIITLIVGIFPFIFVKETHDISLKDGFMTMVLAWVLSCVFGMLPYVLWGGDFTIINAWYESVSGYTTTGGTILSDVESLPKGLVFWRSSTHFIGGLGIVIFLLLIMPKRGASKLKLTNIEMSSLAKQGYHDRPMKAVNIMFFVYIGLIVVETILLVLAGMPLFDAINHSFSTVATGGFSTKNNSIAFYDSTVIDVIIIVFMILSSLNFGVLFAAVASRSFKPLNNPVTKFFLGTFIVLSVVTSLNLIASGIYDGNWGRAILDGTFQVSSQISTTGFAIADNNPWPPLACMMLLYGSFQCGCSGSTNGGVKSDRMLILFKSIGHQMKKAMHPSYVSQIKVGTHWVNDEKASQVVTFICLYAAVLLTSFFLLLMCGVDVPEAFSGPLTCMSNSGPGMGAIGTMGNYSSLPSFAKFILTADMLVGRMELYPIFLVFMTAVKREF